MVIMTTSITHRLANWVLRHNLDHYVILNLYLLINGTVVALSLHYIIVLDVILCFIVLDVIFTDLGGTPCTVHCQGNRQGAADHMDLKKGA